MFTRDRSGTDPVRFSDRIGLLFYGTVLEPVRNGSKTGPAVLQVQYRIRSAPVPERSRVNTWTGSKQFHVNRSRSGPARFGTVPDRSRVNVALVSLDFLTCSGWGGGGGRAVFGLCRWHKTLTKTKHRILAAIFLFLCTLLF